MSRQRFQQVAALFERAIELPTGDRTAFVDKACGQDPDLRAEVQALLARHRPGRPGRLEALGDAIRKGDCPGRKRCDLRDR